MLYRIDVLRDEMLKLVEEMKGEVKDGHEFTLAKGYLDQGFERLRRAFTGVPSVPTTNTSRSSDVPPDVVG